jgi:hypothetical protein
MVLTELMRLLTTPTLAELGPGPRAGVRPEPVLRQSVTAALAPARVLDEAGELVEALVLLWHDHLDSAHTIAQKIETADGAFVHGIMHRREPDYGNAKYWFRRVGEHPAFPELVKRVSELDLGGSRLELAGRLIKGGRWDAFAMVDACEEVASGPVDKPLSQFLREVQRLETVVLLERFLRS